MIGRILYRENCQGILNYVFGKKGMSILGYGNMYSQDISQRFFGNVLHFQGQRNATKNRYAHITLNLPHCEHLDDKAFHELSEEYMEQMGYGEQPYVVVRHNDTKHEHVHIVTTNVDEAGKVIGIFNSHRRNMATQRHLEKKYGLSPSPEKKEQRELPLYRLPQLQSDMDHAQGTKFYLQDVLNSILQKHKVRGFEELARLVRPYHIELKLTKNETGRIGVSYGLDNQNGYRTRFINGSTVHRNLSGPKLQKVFNINSSSKLLPMHRKRLSKQVETTYALFKTIRPNELADVLKVYQGIDIRLDRKGDIVQGYTIYDKSGYVFQEAELGKHIKMWNRLDIFGKGDSPTEMDIESKQFRLEIQKLIKEAFYASYLKTKKRTGLFSEHIETKNLRDVLQDLTTLEKYRFLERYLPNNQKVLFRKAVQNMFPIVRDRLVGLETKKERETLEGKFRLIGDILEKGIFDVGVKGGSVRYLFQALGVEYRDDRLYSADSSKHSIPIALGNLPSPKDMEEYVSTGFVRQNHLLLEMLTAQNSDNGSKLTATAFFLPMVFPKLFERMHPVYRQRYEHTALGSYLEHAERMHAPFERSAKDYISFFNAKGFYFVKGENALEIKSIYTDKASSYVLPKRTNLYLSSTLKLAEIFREQQAVINDLEKNGRNHFKNLWTGHLMELGLYDRVAFMLTAEKVYPNLHGNIVQHHMDKGLRQTVHRAMERKTSIQQNRLLKKGVYSIGSLLVDRDGDHEEVFNGFRDELTDWSKHKGKEISF